MMSSGHAASPPTHFKSPAHPSPDMPDAPYRIGAGDDVEIKFFLTPEFNNVVRVRPDGKISLMFAQDVQAAGKTPEQLASNIKKRVSPHLKQPELVVTVHSFGSQRAYIGGEVGKPGHVQLLGHETLLQVLTEAGWTTPSNIGDIILVRRNADGKAIVYHLNIQKIMSGEDSSQDVIVQAGDIILAPPAGSIEFDRWVDRNIRQAMPFSPGFVINRGVGPR